jgi:O-antigen/teichoic acid export membrane protein
MSESKPSQPAKSEESSSTQRVVARGAFVNVLGMIGKLLLPVSFIVITRLFGPDVVGVFLLGFILVDVATNLTVSGINDGVLMLASREDVAKDDEGVHRVLSNGFAMSLAVAAAMILVAYNGGPRALHWGYEDASQLIPLVQIMVLAVPFRVIGIVVVAATKVKLTMKWDALLSGFGRSAAFLIAAVVAYFVDVSATSLAWAYVAGWVAVGVVAMLVFPAYYRYGALLREFGRFKFSSELVRFAIPQNLNMAFGRFATDIDAMMLAYFGVPPAQLSFYWMGGQVVRNVRQIKLIFSGAYAPLIARLHAAGDREGMNRSFSMVSRWATTLALPVALIIIFFRGELIWLFHDTFTDDTSFMLLLLVVPLLSCSFGLASNVIVMTGHSGWNLFNSLTMAALNIVLNYLLIPRYGILGAAMATVLASVFTTTLALIEARMLVGVSLQYGQVYKPFAAGLAAGTVATVWLLAGPTSGLLMNLAGCAIALAVYAVVLFSLKVPEEDINALLPWRRRPAAT